MLSSSQITQFRKSSIRRDALAELQKSSTFQSALLAIEMAAIPRSDPDQRPGLPYDSTLAHDRQFRKGVAEAIATLRGMMYPPNLAPDEMVDVEVPEFEDSISKEYQLANQPK